MNRTPTAPVISNVRRRQYPLLCGNSRCSFCRRWHAERTETAVVGWSACCRSAPTRKRKSILHTIGCAGAPSFGGPRTIGAQASQSKNQALPILGKWSSFVLHMIGALAICQSNFRSNFRYVVAARPGVAYPWYGCKRRLEPSQHRELAFAASLIHTGEHESRLLVHPSFWPELFALHAGGCPSQKAGV